MENILLNFVQSFLLNTYTSISLIFLTLISKCFYIQHSFSSHFLPVIALLHDKSLVLCIHHDMFSSILLSKNDKHFCLSCLKSFTWNPALSEMKGPRIWQVSPLLTLNGMKQRSKISSRYEGLLTIFWPYNLFSTTAIHFSSVSSETRISIVILHLLTYLL